MKMAWVLILVLTGSGKSYLAVDMASKEACVQAMKGKIETHYQYCLNRETGEVVRHE